MSSGSPGVDEDDRLFAPLVAVLTAVQPYLTELTLIGGWVPALYRRIGGFSSWTSPPTLTIEADILAPDELPLHLRPPLADILRTAGFSPFDDSQLAARWSARPPRGEQIDFLVAHAGPARRIGRPRIIDGQPGVAAISLPGLEALGRHTITMRLPFSMTSVSSSSSSVAPLTTRVLSRAHLSVRVPTLGVYAIQKAATFRARLSTASVHASGKAAKDLLYLQDLAAGGRDVTARIDKDVRAAMSIDPAAIRLLSSGRSSLHDTIHGALNYLLTDVARMVVEREPHPPVAAARASVAGHLSDLLDLLATIEASR